MPWADFWQDSGEDDLLFFPEIDICLDPKVISYPDRDNSQLGLDTQSELSGLFLSLPCGDPASASVPCTIPEIVQTPTPPLSSTYSQSPATDPGDLQPHCFEGRLVGKHRASPLPWEFKPDERNSSSSCDAECTQEEASQRITCSECSRDFANLGALGKHTQETLHKAWRCSEPDCGKSYARRDTFLRHKVTHKKNGHPCLACANDGRQKVFKRKDHLREHVRKCHPMSSESNAWVTMLPGSHGKLG